MEEQKDEVKISEKRMQEFAERFEKEIFPVIMGEDGKGLARFKKIVAEKRKDVEKRKQARKQKFNNEGGDY